MSLFCLLWVPLFYLFRRSVSPADGGGGVWALLLGSVTAIFQFFLGALVIPGGFGLSRWMSGFVDIVSLPVIMPMVVYLLFVVFRVFSGNADFANFALLWLIPSAALRSVSWSSMGSPLLLVLAPLLWTALGVGIPFFINRIIGHLRWYVVISASFGILTLPFLAATSWWAFFSQRTAMGFLLLFTSLIPMAVSIVLDCIHGGE
jgi:hypothetical protein